MLSVLKTVNIENFYERMLATVLLPVPEVPPRRITSGNCYFIIWLAI